MLVPTYRLVPSVVSDSNSAATVLVLNYHSNVRLELKLTFVSHVLMVSTSSMVNVSSTYLVTLVVPTVPVVSTMDVRCALSTETSIKVYVIVRLELSRTLITQIVFL